MGRFKKIKIKTEFRLRGHKKTLNQIFDGTSDDLQWRKVKRLLEALNVVEIVKSDNARIDLTFNGKSVQLASLAPNEPLTQGLANLIKDFLQHEVGVMPSNVWGFLERN